MLARCRWFEEDLGSEVVFWYVAHIHGYSPLQAVSSYSAGKTTPRAPLNRSSTSRIKCGDDGFCHVSFDVLHHSSTGDLQRARTKVPRVSYTGDNFASMSSFLTKCLFGEMPERLQVVLFTLRMS